MDGLEHWEAEFDHSNTSILDMLEWPDYWDRFIAGVDLQRMADVTKLTYLKSTLSGAAAKAIEGISVTGANYTTVKQILCERFGRTEAIISSLYSRLEDILRAGDSFSDIRHVQSDMEAILRQLETQGEQLNEQRLLCQKLWSKLPVTVATKLEESRGLADAGTQWKLHDFRTALKRYVIMQETVLCRTNTGGTMAEDATRYSAGALVTGAHKFTSRNKSDGDWNASSKRGCAFCGGSHLDKSCTKYATVAQRKEQLIE